MQRTENKTLLSKNMGRNGEV